MIQVGISVLQSTSFFNDFYHRVSQLLLDDKDTQENKYCVQSLVQQEPVMIVSAVVSGHAMQHLSRSHNNEERELIAACASVSILCKVLSAVAGHNIRDIVSLKAEHEGNFEFKVDYQAMIHSVSLHTLHHYIEVFGAMKSFVVGIQLIAQNTPSALQCTIDVV